MNDSITATLRALTGDTERLLTEQLRPIGLTVPQMQFLTVLTANPGHCGADVAEAVHVSPQTGTTVLQNLVAKRLITVRHVPGKGRRHKITVTARGKKALDQATEAVADVEKRLAALLGPEAAFRMADAIGALQPHLPSRMWQTKRSAAKTQPKQENANADKVDQLHRHCLDWAATVGEPGTVPGHVARQFGTQAQIDLLVESGRWKPDGDGYRIND